MAPATAAWVMVADAAFTVVRDWAVADGAIMGLGIGAASVSAISAAIALCATIGRSALAVACAITEAKPGRAMPRRVPFLMEDARALLRQWDKRVNYARMPPEPLFDGLSVRPAPKDPLLMFAAMTLLE
jgi:hypothetical protein